MKHSRILIVGSGNITPTHVDAILAISPETEIRVLRRANSLTREFTHPGVELMFDIESANAWEPDGVIIANAAIGHLEACRLFAANAQALMIEKPLASNESDVDSFQGFEQSARERMRVAYPFRFSRSVERLRQALECREFGEPIFARYEVGQFLPDWRPGTDWKSTVSAQTNLGGGVVLELSHELDLAILLGGEVTSWQAVGLAAGLQGTNVETMFNANLTHASGMLSNVSCDLLQRTPTRSAKVVCERGEIIWDGIRRTVQSGNGEYLFGPNEEQPKEMYRRQAAGFLSAVAGGGWASGCTLEQASEVCRLALDIRDSIIVNGHGGLN